MKQPKFTPGPWVVEDFVGVTSVDGVTLIAEAYTNAAYNAGLIASAPEMYDALLEAKAQIEYLHEKFAETGSGNQVLSKINALLEKATL